MPWSKGVSGNPLGLAPGQKRLSRYVMMVTRRLLRGRELEHVYSSLEPQERAVFIMALLKVGLESQRLESDVNAIENMPEELYVAFREFLRQKQQPVIFIEDDTTEEKQN
jgi:hypothetical protein